MRLQERLRSRLAALAPAPAGVVAERLNYSRANEHRWASRTAAAAQLWAAHDARWRPPEGGVLQVADLGAGGRLLHGVLETRLPYPIEYRAFDLHPQHPATMRLDVRQGLPAASVDVAFCLGLLEYVEAGNPLIARLRRYARCVVTSYVGAQPDRITMAQRRRNGWARHQTTQELEAEFVRAGFTRVATAEADGGLTTLWLWSDL
jgi:hypothetical protein